MSTNDNPRYVNLGDSPETVRYGRHHTCQECEGTGEVWSEIDGKCDYCNRECWCSGCTDGETA
jgi:hypothetical protein